MPVSPLPILFPFVVLCILIGGIIRTLRTYSRCRVLRHIAIVVILLFLPALVTQLKGIVLRQLASDGDPKWQLVYSDWFFAERNLHQELILAPGVPWDGDHFFQYLSDSAAQGYVPAMRKYMAWVEQSPARMENLRIHATYNDYRRQLGDVADYSYWRESTPLRDLTLVYAMLAIIVQILFWRGESRYQKSALEQEIADAHSSVKALPSASSS